MTAERRAHGHFCVMNVWLVVCALALSSQRPTWYWWPISEGYFWRFAAVLAASGALCNGILFLLPEKEST